MRAFGKLAELYKDLSKLLATSTHVCELVQVLDTANATAQPPAAYSPDGSIVLENADIVTPTHRLLAARVSLTVQPHHDLIVVRPEFC
jgi:hypothetical protein